MWGEKNWALKRSIKGNRIKIHVYNHIEKCYFDTFNTNFLSNTFYQFVINKSLNFFNKSLHFSCWFQANPWKGMKTLNLHIFKKSVSVILLHCTWSCKNSSFAIWTIRSMWMIPPMLVISISATRVSTMMASTSSCRYSGWGTWFSTDSTWTANLISPSVIYNTCTHGLINLSLI